MSISSTQLVIALAAGVAGTGFIGLILVPAVSSYSRLWERFAAGFLTLYILATLVGAGALLGLFVVWSYDRWA
jgi:hypothetical protein